MKSILKTLGTAGLVTVALMQSAFADTPPPSLPEPGTLPLVGLAIAAIVLVARRKK